MKETIYLVTAFIVLIIAVNPVAWLIILPRYVSRKISRFQNELVNCHYDEVDIMYRKMRGWRHDYHNHIQTLKAYMELEQYDEVKKYMDMLEEDLSAESVHGFGLVSIDRIVDKYNGYINRQTENGVFATEVMLPMLPPRV
ncbi:MAG: Spo0B domain-containing protein [Roseburia sp.]|nr:Spo0B domain-containing protein [Roseburia sp.]